MKNIKTYSKTSVAKGKGFLLASAVLLLCLMNIQLLAQSSFSGERLGNACKGYVIDTRGDDCEVEIMQKMKDYNFKESDVTALFKSEKSSLKGLTTVSLEFYHNGSLIKRDDIRLRVNVFAKTAVASHTLKSGDVIAESDLVYSRVNVTNTGTDKLVAADELIGKTLRNGVIKGYPITKDLIEKEKSIKRGDRVDIIAQSGAVYVRTIGTALQEGNTGETVRVKRDGTGNSILTGVVTEQGTVLIKR